jgi:hypothetical protein
MVYLLKAESAFTNALGDSILFFNYRSHLVTVHSTADHLCLQMVTKALLITQWIAWPPEGWPEDEANGGQEIQETLQCYSAL